MKSHGSSCIVAVAAAWIEAVSASTLATEEAFVFLLVDFRGLWNKGQKLLALQLLRANTEFR